MIVLPAGVAGKVKRKGEGTLIERGRSDVKGQLHGRALAGNRIFQGRDTVPGH